MYLESLSGWSGGGGACPIYKVMGLAAVIGNILQLENMCIGVKMYEKDNKVLISYMRKALSFFDSRKSHRKQTLHTEY